MYLAFKGPKRVVPLFSVQAARDEVLVVIRNAVNSEVVPLSFAERERLARGAPAGA